MRRGEAPVAIAGDTCVLGHAWEDGRVLCPVCGFGRRNAPADDAAETVTVTAVVAMPAAREGEVTSATVSPDGHWAWDGDEWVPASMSAIATTDAAHDDDSDLVHAGAALATGSATALATEEPGSWTGHEATRSLLDPEPGPDMPAYESDEPASIPMPGGPPEPPVGEDADALDADHSAEFADLARLLAIADVPNDDDERHTAAEPVTFEIAPPEPEPVEPVLLETEIAAETDAEPVATEPAVETVATESDTSDAPDVAPEPPAEVPDQPAEPAAAAPVEQVAPSATAGEADTDTAAEQTAVDDTAPDETGAAPRSRRPRQLRELHLSPNGLRAAAVVLAAAVSTVVATGHTPFVHHAGAPAVDTVLQGTLRHVATLETRYASEHGGAALNAATLTPGGYRVPQAVSLSVARTSGQGFCLVGSGPVAGPHSYEVWSSARGGLVIAGGNAVAYRSTAAAQAACPGAGSFSTL